jgi:hypothetical protein
MFNPRIGANADADKLVTRCQPIDRHKVNVKLGIAGCPLVGVGDFYRCSIRTV